MNMRKNTAAAVAAIACVGALGACSSSDDDAKKDTTSKTSTTTSSQSQGGSNVKPTPAPSTPAPVANADIPTRVTVSSIGLDKPLKSMGLVDGKINPPSGVVQWYNAYPSPGKKGNAIIAGHVTYNGPDVFANLHKVRVGDKITVSYKAAPTKTFVVKKKESVDKDDLRKRQDVWGPADKAHLVLITCDSDSGWENDQHHTNNYAVWADPTN